MEKQDAAEFYSELADWAYANGEAMLMEDEPEMQDLKTNNPKNKSHGRNETNDRGNDGRGKGGI